MGDKGPLTKRMRKGKGECVVEKEHQLPPGMATATEDLEEGSTDVRGGAQAIPVCRVCHLDTLRACVTLHSSAWSGTYASVVQELEQLL